MNVCASAGIAIDKANRLYVADSGENRILEFNPPLISGEAAMQAFGQPDFVSNPSNNGAGFGAASLNDPQGLALDASGNLFAADGANNRILKYKEVLPPNGNLSAASLAAFGSQVLNTTSAGKNVTLTNAGGSALTISSISASGDFAQTNNCPASLGAIKTCTITVTFTPKATGNRTGVITISDNNTFGNPQTVALSGSGVVAVSVSTASLNFGTVTVGTTSAIKSVTVTNNQSVSVSLSSAISGANAGDFSAPAGTCTSTLMSKASCTVSTR